MVEGQDRDQLLCRSVGLGFRHDGAGLGEPTPAIIADYEDLCRREADGIWRFEERRITPVFVAGGLQV
jgi:hypothetical protein